MASRSDQCEPLLRKSVTYHENCPGCKVEQLKETRKALPISCLFPFLYFMVRDFHIAETEDIGYYAGYIGSSFMFGRFLTSVLWGIAADKYGRKPIMLIGVFSIVVFNTLFGLSVNFWMAVSMRFLLGSCNGMFGPVKAYASEVCREEHQALGLSIVGTMWGIGLIIGPAIGGFFAQPADKFPDIFSKTSLFGRFPYFLPCLAITIFSIIIFVTTFWLPVKRLEEELENIKGKYDLVVMNTLLNAYSGGRDMEHVMRILKKMDKFKICPDRQTFSILISYFCKEKLYDLAQRTLEDMQVRGHRLTEELCSSVITGLGENGRAEEAFKLYNQLKSNRHTLSTALHEKILNILVSGRMLKEAYTVMKDNSKSISKPCLKKFVIAFAEAGNIYIVGDVFKEFHSTGCKIEQGVLNIALSRYIEQGKKRELIRLLKWMKNQRYELASSTLNSVLKKLRESGQSDVAEMLSHEFTSSGKQVMTL